MSTLDTHLPVSPLRAVVCDLERYRRLNGLLLTVTLLAAVALFRWLNTGPYAGNSVYFALVVVIIGVRAADHQLVRAVTRLAVLLADAEGTRTRDGA